MSNPPLRITYENDLDVRELVYTEITDDKLLDFFFKKGGEVNVTNLQWVVSEYGNKSIAQNLINLETSGLIKPDSSNSYKVTSKARWQRIRDNKTLLWIIGTIGVLSAVLALILA